MSSELTKPKTVSQEKMSVIKKRKNIGVGEAIRREKSNNEMICQKDCIASRVLIGYFQVFIPRDQNKVMHHMNLLVSINGAPAKARKHLG